jgi:hypothetical protein
MTEDKIEEQVEQVMEFISMLPVYDPALASKDEAIGFFKQVVNRCRDEINALEESL